jgi:hypothetical protein
LATPKGGKFKVGDKEFTDTSDLEEGFADMNAWLASREKEKGTGRLIRTHTAQRHESHHLHSQARNI